MEVISDLGFDKDLEGFIIQGTLFIQSAVSSLKHGDGSVKMSGSLYTNKISEYIPNGNLDINNVLFNKNSQQIIIPYNTPSNVNVGSIITNGGITIKATNLSTSITSGGALTILGGVSISKNVIIGDILDMNYNKIINVGLPTEDFQAVNKYYVDHKTFGNLYTNFSFGNLLYGNSSGSISGTDKAVFNPNNNVFTLFNTDNSFDVYGNAKFRSNVDVIKTLNVHGNNITNVAIPLLNTDAANKLYVDSKTFGNLSSNFSTGSLLIGSTSGSISDTSNIFLLNNTLTFYNTNGNTIDSFGKVLLRDTLDLTFNNIINVATPLLSTDAANKLYVDSKTFGNISANFSTGSLLFGNSSGSISDTSLLFFDNKTLFLYNTTGNSLVVSGNIDMTNGTIINVTSPNLGTDVANKYYVDSKTYGNISGNFSSGQVLIGTENNNLAGYNNFIFNGKLLQLNSTFIIRDTTPSNVGITSGSALTVLGGVNIGNGLDVNFNRITSVDYPLEANDAVNKQYIDDLFGLPSEEYIFTKINSVQTIPAIIPGLIFDPLIFKVFVISVYTFANEIYSLYTIRGFLTNTGWIITSTSVNQKNSINFTIDNIGQFFYTNSSSTSLSFIRYRKLLVIDNTFTNYTLSPNGFPQDIGIPFEYLNSQLLVQKITIYVVTSENDYAVFYITLLRKNNTWIYSGFIQGGITGINFNIRSDVNKGNLQYRNSRTTPSKINFSNSSSILTSDPFITLFANTTNKNIDEDLLSFPLSDSSFFITFYVEIPSIGKYAAYDISAILIDSIWNLNIQSIGDNLNMYGISFSIVSSDIIENTVAYRSFLRYTNSGNETAYLKFIVDAPDSSSSLMVDNGGTGTDSFFPTSILRGNGSGPIIGDSKLTFYKDVMILSSDSSILIKNAIDTLNSSTGSLITYGGMYIGKSLIVNDINITPGKGDIHERIFLGENNSIIPLNINNFIFNKLFVKSFVSFICVSITTVNDNLVQLFQLQGYYKMNNWFLYTVSNTGDSTGITFSIQNTGQIQYNSTDIPNWISTSISFNAKCTGNV